MNILHYGKRLNRLFLTRVDPDKAVNPEVKVKYTSLTLIQLRKILYFCSVILTHGVIGNTSDFGSAESWFEPRWVSKKCRFSRHFLLEVGEGVSGGVGETGREACPDSMSGANAYREAQVGQQNRVRARNGIRHVSLIHHSFCSVPAMRSISQRCPLSCCGSHSSGLQ
jgi:hypothetical protein